MKPGTEMMSYQNPRIMDEDKTVVPDVVTTITPPTTTTSIYRSKWIMVAVVAGMMMLVAGGAVLMQDGASYDHSSGSIETEDGGGIMTAVEGLVVGTQGKKTAMTTTTPTLKTVIAQYPELVDISPEEQDFQYQAYLLYLRTGMSSEEMNAYYNITDGQQDGGLVGPGLFPCCKDVPESEGCRKLKSAPCIAHPPVANVECGMIGAGTNRACCRSSPDSRFGRRNMFWRPCI